MSGHAPRGKIAVVVALAAALGALCEGVAHAQQPRPNILVIWGDDIGVHNVSAYTNAIMGYRTPNIDWIAREGALFTDAYGQQSCTTGRASPGYATGQFGKNHLGTT